MQGQVVAALPGCFSPDFALANQSLISFRKVYQYTIQDTLSSILAVKAVNLDVRWRIRVRQGPAPLASLPNNAENRALLLVVLGNNSDQKPALPKLQERVGRNSGALMNTQYVHIDHLAPLAFRFSISGRSYQGLGRATGIRFF